MSFVSVEFIILVIITLTIYYLPTFRNWQPLVLIVAGLVFYGYDNHYRSILLICSALINFLGTYVCLASRNRRLQVISTTVGVFLNLFLLGFFKYGKSLVLIVSSYVAGANEMLSLMGDWTMPIGLSFFTFQGISLLVDALRNKINRQFQGKNRNRFMGQGTAAFLFISFFPTLLSGPIMKGHQFIPQISIKRFHDIDWERCVKELILGYFLKMVIADNLRDQTFWLAYPLFQVYAPTTLLMFLLGYSIQIFADFAGYSLIAIAVARLAGYGLPDNFNFPYISKTFSEFWRRWHISLSTWLRDYLYIPLGGNRKDSMRTYINVFIVMFLGGLWHGSTWNYGLWGAYHGTLLMLERPFRDKLTNPQHPLLNVINGLVVFCLVTVGWLFFKLTEFHEVVAFVKALWANGGIYGIGPIRWILLYSIPIGLYHLLHLLKQRIGAFNAIAEDCLYAVMLFGIICCSGSPSSFIYFQF